MKKIVHLTTVHPPFDTRIFHRECVTLVSAGYDVTLICCHDQDEVVDGVRIRALAGPDSRLQRVTRIAYRIWQAARAEGGDLYHFHDPELLGVALLLRLEGRRVVYDVHEDLPRQLLVKSWIPNMVRPFLRVTTEIVEWVGARLMTGVIPATPLIAEKFPDPKTVMVQNFPIPDELEVSRPTRYPLRNPVFIYVGNLGRARGIREMIDAIDLVPEVYGATLHIAGDFRSRRTDGTIVDERERALFNDYVGRPGWKKVRHHGWVGRRRLAELLGESRAGLVVLHPTPSYRDSYPVKLFEYMAAGIPVIATDFPLWRRIIEKANNGILVDPLDPEQIAEAMIWILEAPEKAEQMGSSGRDAVLDRYNWRDEAAKLLSFYAELLGEDYCAS